MDINKKKYSFVSRYDQVTIHGMCMIPENPKGIIQFVHGMNEHKERFYPFMEKMTQRGYITLIHDNRGHGESVKDERDIGYCYPAKEKGYVEDIYRATKNIRRAYPGLPVILYGHSMGSLAVRAYLKEHDDVVDGLVVGGCPSYNDGVPFGILLVNVLAAWKGERFRFDWMQGLVVNQFERRFRNEGRKSAWLAVKESVAEQFGKDPLCQFTYTMNGLLTLLHLEWIVYKQAGYQMHQPELPILFLSGEEDPCYINKKKWKQGVYRMTELGYENVEAILFENMRHEIHNEEENEKVFDALQEFADTICDHFE